MGQEINLMANYPKTKRDLTGRLEEKTEQDRAIARQFGKEFFDGDRKNGYGGFNYLPRFWQPVIPTFQEHFSLNGESKVLDIGCAKGFMLYDFMQLIPGIEVAGIDISEYAINKAKEEARNVCQVASATKLPFENNTFDAVFSITTLHNLELDDIATAISEINRVLKNPENCFITLDAYNNDEEKARIDAWNLTAKTVLHVDEWKQFFKDVGYKGDFYWFIP